MARVVVIGGGISGLACAHGVVARDPSLEVEVLEAAPRVGGVIRTDRVDGHVFDAGPGGWLDRDPSTRALIKALELEPSVITGNEANRRRFILKGGKLRLFPTDLRSFLSTDLMSLGAKARLLFEPCVPWGDTSSDRTVAEFFTRRLGAAAMGDLIDPILAGIYAGRPEELSLQATLPAVAALSRSRKSLVGRALASRRAGGMTPAYGSLEEGMGVLVDSLGEALSDVISTDSPAASLARDGGQWRVAVGGGRPRELLADCVVLAAPAPVAAGLVSGLDEEIRAFFASVATVPVAVVGLAYGAGDAPALPGFGHLVPSSEPGSVLGVLWSSSIFEGRAERGATLRVILGGWRDRAIHTASDEQLLALAIEAVTSTLGAPARPAAHAIARHEHGLPHYGVGHLDRLEAMERAARRLPGFYVTGNTTHGVGVNACTKSAADVAAAVVDYCASEA